MDAQTIHLYRKWRELRPEMPATSALSYAKAEMEQTAVLDRFGEWTFGDTSGYGGFVHADLDVAPYTLRVLVGDDDVGVEWGDMEPTDDERANATAYYVAVVVLDDDGGEVYHDGIGGVDVIDLPGYLQRDWEDAAGYALIEYLLADAERFARNEATERAYWAACDVMTV